MCLLLSLLLAAEVSAQPIRQYHVEQQLSESGETSAAVSIADFDGDSKPDVLLSTGRHWAAPIRLYRNRGKRAFGDPVTIGAKGYKSYGIPAADFDRDGRLDFAVGTDRNDEKPVYRNDGIGGFALVGPYGPPGMVTRNLAVADLNGDRFPDIIAANRGGGNRLFLNDGRGRFAAALPFGTAEDHTVTVAVADMNGDGHADLILANRDGQQSAIYLNDGKARFRAGALFGPAKADTRAVAVADLNNDGAPDIVASHLGQGTVIYWNKAGAFAASQPLHASGAYSLLVADMNKDGKPDIVQGSEEGANFVHFQTGSRQFRAVSFGEGKGTTYGVAIGDLDGDGFPDIAAARSAVASAMFFSSPVR
ncbi:MAG: VCBS repeat-containing protein [Bryobacterales bacterium]|nr:VCBS repeat-containing protein [Bryobacterales bacterium]